MQKIEKCCVLHLLQQVKRVSEVAANLAISLSKNNDKVLLIDGNLRNPVQHVVFDVKIKD